MRPQEFRVTSLVPMMGVIGILFSVYVAAYSAELTNIVLFPRVDSFREAFPESLAFLCVMFAGGACLIPQIVVRVIVSPSCITYIGVFLRTTIAWADVSSVRIRSHLGNITIRSPRSIIVIDWRFVGRVSLVEQIRRFSEGGQSRVEARQ